MEEGHPPNNYLRTLGLEPQEIIPAVGACEFIAEHDSTSLVDHVRHIYFWIPWVLSQRQGDDFGIGEGGAERIKMSYEIVKRNIRTYGVCGVV